MDPFGGPLAPRMKNATSDGPSKLGGSGLCIMTSWGSTGPPTSARSRPHGPLGGPLAPRTKTATFDGPGKPGDRPLNRGLLGVRWPPTTAMAS